MTTVEQIFHWIDSKAPFALQESWDNSGFLVGDPGVPVRRVLLALDITDQVVEEAWELDAQLIVSHHPLIFTPIKRMTLTSDDLVGRKLWRLARQNTAAICCHTNLDAVEGGVNSALAQRLGLSEVRQLAQEGTDGQGRPYGIGRVGLLPREMELKAFLALVQDRLAPNSLRYVDGGRLIRRVAVGGGACGSMLEDVLRAGCDAFVTSDLKYNHFLDAKELGLTLVDAGHFPTENVVLPVLSSWLKEGFPELEVSISRVHHEVICCNYAEK
ncbi:MAG: Nif3-like dinuclear metal center hexameric protein [Candidatus Onthomonas sp.]